jgi:hypothetical protein
VRTHKFCHYCSILLMAAVPALAVADQTGACKTETQSHLAGVTSQALATLVTSNVQDFCDESVIEGVGSMNLNADPKFMTSIMNDPDKLYEFAHLKLGGPWEKSWLPNEKLREEALYNGSFANLYFNDEVNLLEKKAAPLTTDEKTQIHNAIKAAFPSGTEQQEYGLIDSIPGRTLFCAKIKMNFDIHSALDCQHDISLVRKITAQREEHSLPDANEEVLVNDNYREGLRIAALKLLEKVKNGDRPVGDLFSDIKSSFVSSGISPSDAENMTWTVVGVISSSGPNYAQRADEFGGKDTNPQAKVALALIAQSIPLLNLRSRGGDRLYSYPPGIKTTCDNGKPYHFWMSAYLARRISIETKDPQAAATAVFAVEEGYQFVSRTKGRNPERAFTVETFDGFNNIMRMDMTYAAAGAKFGSAAATNSPVSLNIDSGIQKIVQQSEITPSISMGEARSLIASHPFQAFNAWSERFAPDSVFNLFNP